jgi:hypothetical protein
MPLSKISSVRRSAGWKESLYFSKRFSARSRDALTLSASDRGRYDTAASAAHCRLYATSYPSETP